MATLPLVPACAVALLLLLASTVRAEGDWRFDQRQVVVGYTTLDAPNDDGPYNRDNRVAAIAGNVSTLEWRADLRLRNDACTVQLGLRANLQYRGDRASSGVEADAGTGAATSPSTPLAPVPSSRSRRTSRDLYGRTGGVACRLGEAWEVRAGRYVLGWGSATFRSPSNPFYADTGKTDPVREQVGIDLAELSWRGGNGWSASLIDAYAQSSRTAAPGGPVVHTPTALLRVEKAGDDSTIGLVASHSSATAVRFGGYATRTVDQALIVFGEGSWRRDRDGLYPEADPASPVGWRFAAPAGRSRVSLLVGGAYTFESGWTLTAEGLYDQTGYSASQRAQARAAVTAADAVLAAPRDAAAAGAAAGVIGNALQPGLSTVGRRTAFLQLARNEWHNRADVALRWAYDFDDRGANWSGSLTWFATPRVELLALASLSTGGDVQGRVLRHVVLLGVRSSF